MKEITKCRVCGGPLVGYFGLCAEHHEKTLAYWKRLKENIEWAVKDAQRVAKGGGTR